MGKQALGIIGGIVATVLFIAVNVFANNSMRGVRIDLTEESLFTLSAGSASIAADVDEEIHLYYYYSTGAARQFQDVVDYERRVRDMLDECVRNSNGKLVLEVIDPEPFSDAEERAVRDGIAGIQTMTDILYFGLVGTNATDDRQVIPFFGERVGGGISFVAKERFLEYDVSRMIHSLAHPKKSVVGILSALPIEGGPGNPMTGQGQTPRWKFLDQLAYFYDLRILESSISTLPTDIDVLVLVHPRETSEVLQYEIDQFVMGGGKLIAFVDPHCDADMSQADPSNPMGQFGASKASDLNRLFQAWGFEIVPNKVVGDYDNALEVPMRAADGRSIQYVNYVAWMTLGDESLSREDPITSLLQNVLIVSPGSLRAVDGATTTLTPLVETGENAMEIDVGRFMFRPDPQAMLDSFVSGKKALTVVARISGETASAFPDGPPTGMESDSDRTHLAASNGPIHVITVADADMLYDQWWVRENIIGGINFGQRKVSDNCDLLVHSIENLTGGADLISIRARGRFSRPFDTVDEIEREARKRFTDKQKELQRKMSAAEEEIARLGQERDPEDPDARLMFSDDQQAAYERALETRTTLRRQLRDVQHDMDKDITALGRKIKAFNIFAVPLLVSVFAIGLGVWRIQRRGK